MKENNRVLPEPVQTSILQFSLYIIIFINELDRVIESFYLQGFYIAVDR